jgi:chaperonin cofactor prefoldin
MALIFKEKMHQEVKKRSERLKEFTDNIHTKMRNIEKELNHAWTNIMKEMEKYESSVCCS